MISTCLGRLLAITALFERLWTSLTACLFTDGHIADPALGSSPFSWDGALATLQVAHQFFTWTRKVANHTVGGESFDYPMDLPGLAEWSQPRHCWGVNTTRKFTSNLPCLCMMNYVATYM